MANDVKLQEGQVPLDEHLRPLKVGGETSSVEIAKHGSDIGMKVTGDLEVTGTSPSDDTKLPLAGGTMTGDIATASDFTLDVGGDLTLDASGGDIKLETSGNTSINIDCGVSPAIRIFESAGGTDYCDIATASSGVTTISTVDAAGADADFILDIDGDITLNSVSGNFIAEKAGTEFSAANSAYAGMILGYTEMAYGTTSGRYNTTTSFEVINDNYDHSDGAEDHFLGVTFVVPPSNNVEIEVYLPYVLNVDGILALGLATATDATTLKAKFEVAAWDVDESDTVQIVQRWVIDGSDSGMTGGAWSAGESKTLYCMAKEGTAGGRLYWGDGFINYGDMTMKATALPATIGDGT